MIYTMLKSPFINIEPKLLNYWEYKNFPFGNFKEDISEALLDCRNSCDEFESAFVTELDKYTLKKKKWIRRNNKPHITKPIRQAITKQSKLKIRVIRRNFLLIIGIFLKKNSKTMW